MNRTARMLSIPQELRFLIVFRSPLSEPVNEFGQFFSSDSPEHIIPDVKKGHIFPMLKLSEIRLKRAPIFSPILTLNGEKPVKASFSVPVEDTLNYRSVCQIKADLHLTQCLLLGLQPMLFSPTIITHMNLLNPARTPL